MSPSPKEKGCISARIWFRAALNTIHIFSLIVALAPSSKVHFVQIEIGHNQTLQKGAIQLKYAVEAC